MTETTSGEAQPRALLISAQSADKLAELCREAARSPFRYGLRRQTDARETLGKYRRAAVASGETEAAEILLAP